MNANETGRKNTCVTETCGPERDDVSVWELIGLNLVGTFRSRFELIVVVPRHVVEFLFDVTIDLCLSGGRERVPALSEDLHQILSKTRASQISRKDGVRQSVTFEMGIVCDTPSPKSNTKPVFRLETY